MKTKAIYERVSTRNQDHASQHGDLDAWSKGKSGVKWYSDTFSGKTMNRPSMNRLMDDIRAGRVESVTVWRLDRLGRTAKGLTALFEELREYGVNLVSVRDGIDLATTAGRLIANVLASVAAYETEIRSERITAGIEAKRARGEKWGNGRKAGNPDKLIPAVRMQIVRMKKDKAPVAEIAAVLHLSRQSVYNVLNDEK